MPLYPLKFVPLWLDGPSSGRRLAEALQKSPPAGRAIGGTLELFDGSAAVPETAAPPPSSLIANGPLAGKTLRWAMEQFPGDLLGRATLTDSGHFPVSIRFIDCESPTPIQIHGGTGAWYVVACEPGAVAYRGLQRDTTREMFAAGLGAASALTLLKAHAVKPGHAFFLPPGMPHALGPGVVVADIRTAEEPVHHINPAPPFDANTLEATLAAIDFSHAAEPPQKRGHVAGFFTTVSRLVTGPRFKVEKVRFVEGIEEPLPYRELAVWVMLQGRAQVRVADIRDPVEFGAGDTMLLPAAMSNPIMKTLADCAWLEVTLC